MSIFFHEFGSLLMLPLRFVKIGAVFKLKSKKISQVCGN